MVMIVIVAVVVVELGLATRRCGPWPDVSPTAMAASFWILSSAADL